MGWHFFSLLKTITRSEIDKSRFKKCFSANPQRVMRRMRATSAKFLKPTESDEPDLREGWLRKLKAKFSEEEKITLADEFENLDSVVLPKMSFFAQEEFYKALKSLTLYELQGLRFPETL